MERRGRGAAGEEREREGETGTGVRRWTGGLGSLSRDFGFCTEG